MKKKCTLSTMLSLIVVVITVIAFGGMTVWADPEPASYDLSPDTYTLTNSGFSDIEFTFDSVNYGTVVNGDKTETTNGLALRFYGGTLSCGENQIDFSVSRNDHNSHSNEVYMSFGNYSNNSFTVAVYVNPAAYRSAPAGTYTGTMTYTSTWYTSHTSVSGSSGSVELTLVIPDQNENIFEYGSRGNISWTFDRSGTLTIIGTGAMGDYKRYDAPWDSCADEIKNVIIGNGITSVGKEAFYFYSSLESVSLPDTITSIGEESFYSCKKLASINFPDSVASIDTNAFRACEVLELDSLPSGLTSLGNWSFAYCNKITTLTLPASIERFGDSAFENCGNLTTVVLSDGSKVIGKNAFASCRKLSSVTIPNSVEDIGAYAFFSTDIASIKLPNNITAISSSTFASCKKLTSIIVPDNVETIGDSAFQNSGLASIYIPNGVTTIGSYTFYYCKNLTAVDLPSSLTTIDSSAFNCSNLAAIDIPSSVTKIGYQAFSNTMISSLTVPGSVTDFGDYAFDSCYYLKDVTLEEGVTTIPACAFYKNIRLETISIPSTITSIGDEAFRGCDAVEAVYCYADPDHLTWTDPNHDDFKSDGSTICVVRNEYLDKYLANFTHVNVTFIGAQISMGIGDHLYGYTVCLEGDLGVNFYMKFDDVDALEDDAKMVFTIKSLDGRHTKTQTVYVKPQADTSLPYAKVNNSYYIFKCSVNAKEMTSVISAQITNGNDQGNAYAYSVQEYAAYILANPTLYPGEQDLVKAMLNYGAYSQIYFNYNTDNLANSFMAPEDCDVSSVTESSLPAIPVFSNQILFTGNGRIILDGVSLALESETVMNLYFKGDLDGVYFMCNGKRLAATNTSEGSVKVAVTGIPAQNIDNIYDVDLYLNDSKIGTFKYSPLKYCYNVLNRELTPERTAELKDCVRALCLFNQKADAYLSH